MTSIKDSRDLIKKLHVTDRSATIKNAIELVIFFSISGIAIVCWKTIAWPLTPLCWLLGGHFGHCKPLMFHDAAHGTLHSNRRANEIVGFGLGTLILVPITVYRHAHSLHHAYLATPRDPELWPFTIPEVPRWQRLIAATLEIAFGFLYTPFLMFLSLRQADGLPLRDRLRILLEYAAILTFWSLICAAVTLAGVWEYFLVGYVVPVAVAGMYQTLNKYTEHLGLTGNSLLANTRTVAAETAAGQFLSYTMQHVDHHGTHHRFAKIPYYNLPKATPHVYESEEGPLFHSYWDAFCDMAKTLSNPRSGGQWREHDARTARAALQSQPLLHDTQQGGFPLSGARG